MAVIIKKDGTKLYPCCGFEENQHKLYNAYDVAICALYDVYKIIKDIVGAYDLRH